MNVDTSRMQEYADFMEEQSRQIINLCNQIEQSMGEAIQYMDQVSGLNAAKNLMENMENIKVCAQFSDDTCKKLVLAKKRIEDASRVFGGR